MVVRFFDSQVEKFIHSLERGTIAKVLRTIDLLELFGNNLSLPHSRKVGNGLFELRIRGKQEIRIFYTFHKNETILLYGFLKKTRRTPQKEIRNAMQKIKKLT